MKHHISDYKKTRHMVNCESNWRDNMNQKYLDEFGNLFFKKCYKRQVDFNSLVLSDKMTNKVYKDINDLYMRLDARDKSILKNYIEDVILGLNHDFLNFFEENYDYKLVYSNNNKVIDLRKLSEKSSSGMLHGEIFTWIDKYGDKDE